MRRVALVLLLNLAAAARGVSATASHGPTAQQRIAVGNADADDTVTLPDGSRIAKPKMVKVERRVIAFRDGVSGGDLRAVGKELGANASLLHEPVQSKIRVPLSATRTLNATGQSRVNLSLQ